MGKNPNVTTEACHSKRKAHASIRERQNSCDVRAPSIWQKARAVVAVRSLTSDKVFCKL